MTIDKGSDIPIHHQLEEMIIDRVRSSKLQPGDRVESEFEISKKFGISRSTVRNVYDRLVSRNILFRRAGKGTYVSIPPTVRNGSLLVGFSKKMNAISVMPKTSLIKREVKNPSAPVLDKLKIGPNELIIEIQRIRSIKDIPFVVHTANLPYERCRPVMEADLEKTSLTSFIETGLGISILFAEETVYALPAEKDEAEALDIKKGFPILVTEGISYDFNGMPIRFSIAKYRSDVIRLKTTHKKEL